MSNQVFITDVDAVRATGADVGSFLQGQLSQDVVEPAAGSAMFSLLLAPQGKLDAWLRVIKVSDTEMLLITDRGFGAAVIKRLERFKMRVDVTFVEEPFRRYFYPDPAELVAIEAHHRSLGHHVAPAWAINGLDAFDQAAHPLVTAPDTEIGSAKDAALDRLRRGEPAMGSELDESTIPAEAGIVDRSASFTKGCYTGQELVARVDSRGSNTPRKLRSFESSGPLPSVGAEVQDDNGGAIGVLTSVEPTQQGWLGLGYVKRAALELTTAIVDSSAVTISLPGHMDPT